MKRILFAFTLTAFVSTSLLHAEESGKKQAEEETSSAILIPVNSAAPAAGDAAAESAAVAASSDWQNWVFAGCILAVVTAGVVIVSLNQGHDAPSH